MFACVCVVAHKKKDIDNEHGLQRGLNEWDRETERESERKKGAEVQRYKSLEYDVPHVGQKFLLLPPVAEA